MDEKYGDFSLFPVGTRVRINVRFQDFYFFNTKETGIVIRNTGEYLSVIVAFDTARHFEGDYIQYKFNFNPSDLVLLEKSNPELENTAKELRIKLEPSGCEHCHDSTYCDKGCRKQMPCDKCCGNGFVLI